jgi:hypothetical protein
VGVHVLIAAAKPVAHTSLQWSTLAWIAGAVVAAALIIAIIVVLSRRPKSMEVGMAEFSRSLQAVAPGHRPPHRPPPEQARPSTVKTPELRPARAPRGGTDAV